MWSQPQSSPVLDDEAQSEPRGQIGGSDLWLLEPTDSFPNASDAPDAGQDGPLIFGAPELERYHGLVQDPDPGPEHTQIWRYTPTDQRRLFADVRSVADANTFIGRALLVITRGGDSKNFEEITGQDGLTFGITDFAGNQGCADFFREFYENYGCFIPRREN